MFKAKPTLDYLKIPAKGYPKIVNWEVIAKGYYSDKKEKRLDPIQLYDAIYDEYDLKIRQLGKYAPVVKI